MEFNDQTLMEYLKKQDAKSEATLEALQNVYGVMQKQESRYTAEEEARRKKEEEEKLEKSHMEEASRWDSVVKNMTESITKNVTEAVSKAFQGMDVDGKTPHKVDGGDVSIPQNDKWPASKRTVQEDIEVPAKLRTNTSDVQKPIQAMHEGMPHPEPVVPLAPVMEKVEDYPVEETEGNPAPLDMAALEAMISRLLDEKMVNVQKSTDKKIERFEILLRKSGVREEKGLVGPQLTPLSLGVSTNGNTKETTPIVKSENVSVDGITDEMVKNSSWGDLTNLWIESKGLIKR